MILFFEIRGIEMTKHCFQEASAFFEQSRDAAAHFLSEFDFEEGLTKEIERRTSEVLSVDILYSIRIYICNIYICAS